MLSKAFFIASFALVAQLASAQTPPACLLAAVNTYDNPSDQKTICGKASEVNDKINTACGQGAAAAKQSFNALCKNAGVSVSLSGGPSSSTSASGKTTDSSRPMSTTAAGSASSSSSSSSPSGPQVLAPSGNTSLTSSASTGSGTASATASTTGGSSGTMTRSTTAAGTGATALPAGVTGTTTGSAAAASSTGAAGRVELAGLSVVAAVMAGVAVAL